MNKYGAVMYRIDIRSEAIKNLQRNISKLDAVIGYVAPSGIYDEVTANAVREFQSLRGLSTTGIADYITFNMIYEEGIRNEKEKARRNKFTGVDFPIKIGAFGYEILNLNAMLREILEFYGVFIYNGIGRSYDSVTEDALSFVREIFGIEGGGEVTSELYERIVTEYDSLKK